MLNRLIICYDRIEDLQGEHYTCVLDTGINSYHNSMYEILSDLIVLEYPIKAIKAFILSDTYKYNKGNFIWGRWN